MAGEIEQMAQVARLELDGIRLAIDLTGMTLQAAVRLAKFLQAVRYSQTEGATNIKNLYQKTQGNLAMVEFPDECRQEFETFCKKNGILCSRLYDFNVSDGMKQYLFDANQQEQVFQVFAQRMQERHGEHFRKLSDAAQEQTGKIKQEIFHNEEKRREFASICKRMEEGQPVNEVENLAAAMGYRGKDDPAFKRHMERAVAKKGDGAYLDEAERQMKQWETRVSLKKRELENQAGLQERLYKQAKNMVHPIRRQDYIETGKFSMDAFEQELQRMAEDFDSPSYGMERAAEALRQDTPIPSEIEERHPDKQDYIYDPENPDIVIRREYYRETEDGREVGTYHKLEFVKDGERFTLNDKGLTPEEYQKQLEDFLKTAGIRADSRVSVLDSEQDASRLAGTDKKIKEKPPVPGLSGTTGKEKLVVDFMDRERAEKQERQKQELSYKEYSAELDADRIFQDPFSPDRVRIPIIAEDRETTLMVEVWKDSLLSAGNGMTQVHFNGKDMFYAYELDAVQPDGKITEGISHVTISGTEFQKGLERKGLYDWQGKKKGQHDITIDRSMIQMKTDTFVSTRIPGTYGEHVQFLHVPADRITMVNDDKTILTQLEDRKRYDIYDGNGRVIKQMDGRELYKGHYDPVVRNYKKQEGTDHGKHPEHAMQHEEQRSAVIKTMRGR